jgi:hypothetical protein
MTLIASQLGLPAQATQKCVNVASHLAFDNVNKGLFEVINAALSLCHLKIFL